MTQTSLLSSARRIRTQFQMAFSYSPAASMFRRIGSNAWSLVIAMPMNFISLIIKSFTVLRLTIKYGKSLLIIYALRGRIRLAKICGLYKRLSTPVMKHKPSIASANAWSVQEFRHRKALEVRADLRSEDLQKQIAQIATFFRLEPIRSKKSSSQDYESKNLDPLFGTFPTISMKNSATNSRLKKPLKDIQKEFRELNILSSDQGTKRLI